MSETKVKRRLRTRADKVHGALRKAILEQRLRPGTRLPEDAIGDSFGTSRTIAREALVRLSVEGLIDLVPNRGAFVANPSLDEGRNIFTVRKGLEVLVVTQLVMGMSAETEAALANLMREANHLASKTKTEAIRLAGEFHLRLAELTGNALLLRYVTEVVSRCSLVLAMYGRPHSAECAASEHLALIQALMARDSARAAELMERHLDSVAGRALIEPAPVRDLRTILSELTQQSDGL